MHISTYFQLITTDFLNSFFLYGRQYFSSLHNDDTYDTSGVSQKFRNVFRTSKDVYFEFLNSVSSYLVFSLFNALSHNETTGKIGFSHAAV